MKINRMAMGLLGGLMLAGVAATAPAETITYSTSGVFTSTSTNVINVGNGMTITFLPLSSNSVTAPPPTFGSLGTFEVSGSPGPSSAFSDTFTLTITQSAPSGGSGDFTATVSGAVTVNASVATAVFNTPYSIVLGDVSYTLLSPSLPLVPPSTNNGDTTVEAQITTSVPTPASVIAAPALLGLMYLGKARRRRNLI